MAVADSSKPFSYDLEVCTLVNNEGEGFDLRKVFGGIKIHESITQNFLLGEIGIVDSTGLLENARIFGQETLRIRFKSPFGLEDEMDDEDVIDQIFRIYNVGQVQRVGQNTLIYNLKFCSPELLQAKRIRVSQALRGSLTNMAAQLAEDHLGIKVENKNKKLTPYFEVREKSSEENFQIVIPNWSVNYAMNYLIGEAQGTKKGSGLQDCFFFYQTANAGFRIQSLDSMMKVDYLNGDPFVYTPADQGDPQKIPWDNVEPGRMGMGRRILSYQILSTAKVLEATVNGFFGSKQITVDNTFQYHHDRSYSYLDKFYEGKGQAMNDHPLVRTTDETMYIGESADQEETGDLVSGSYAEYKNISSYGDANVLLLSDRHYVNDEKNKINQPSHNAHEGQEQYRQALDQLLKYYKIQILLPVRTDISVGNLINLEIDAVRPGEESHSEAYFHTGKHLITDIMWELTLDECKTHITVIKDSLINQIETTVPELPQRLEADDSGG
tara:strand:+ start:4954 stop:6444 length:1491 start_codon:yes stop_codon:yes gene_type:complete